MPQCVLRRYTLTPLWLPAMYQGCIVLCVRVGMGIYLLHETRAWAHRCMYSVNLTGFLQNIQKPSKLVTNVIFVVQWSSHSRKYKGMPRIALQCRWIHEAIAGTHTIVHLVTHIKCTYLSFQTASLITPLAPQSFQQHRQAEGGPGNEVNNIFIIIHSHVARALMCCRWTRWRQKIRMATVQD